MGVTSALLTVEQFSQLPPDDTMQRELVEGEIACIVNSGFIHETIKMNCAMLLMRHVIDYPIGRVYAESMYKLGPNEARIPDVSFLLNERIPAKATKAMPEGAPELAFEVVSSEGAADLEHKINLFLANGCRVFWVAYPDERTILVRRPNGMAQYLREGDHHEEPDLLPGFRVLVSRFFEGI